MPTFRPNEHLRKPSEFTAVYDTRSSAADGVLLVYVKRNDLPHRRVGLSVSKKFGGAVVRNRIRRLLREAFRLERDGLPAGLDYVLIPRTRDDYHLEAFRKSLPRLARQAERRLIRADAPRRSEDG